MKKTIAIILLGLSSVVSADLVQDAVVDTASTIVVGKAISEATSSPESQIKPHFEKAEASKPAFFYVRFTAAESDVARMGSVLPGFGVGYRRLAGNGAADISISGIGAQEKKNAQLYWTFPKASYLHYFRPDQKESFYVGGGLAWGGLETPNNRFVGIVPSFTGGYEFVRKSTVLGFTELNISQPALPVYSKGDFPGPIAEVTVGIGF